MRGAFIKERLEAILCLEGYVWHVGPECSVPAPEPQFQASSTEAQSDGRTAHDQDRPASPLSLGLAFATLSAENALLSHFPLLAGAMKAGALNSWEYL